MDSRDQLNPLDRFLYGDHDYNRMVARFCSASESAPSLPTPALQFCDAFDAADYAPSDFPEYTTSSDRDSYTTPADFMNLPNQGEASHPGSSSGHSSYTAAYCVPRSHSSNTYSVGTSIFTRASAATPSSAMSSLPPRRPDITNFNQALVAMAAADYAPVADAHPLVPAPAQSLWCELCVLRDCPTTFRIDQTGDWIEHHCRHLNDRYPAQLSCWFCDDMRFIAADNTEPERYGNFRDRMEHIRRHVSEDYKVMKDMRPDFHMIDHLGQRGIIDASMRKLAFKYSEVPAALRLPGSSSSSSRAGAGAQAYNPQRRSPGPGLAHDLARERRHQRPRGGQRHRTATVQEL